MYSIPVLARKYIRYYFTAANGKGHGAHSPFVFQFITKILNDRDHYPEYDRVEALRKQLLKDQSVLLVGDLGAGSVTSSSQHRTIASIAKNAAKPGKFGQLFFRMARTWQCANILELGTSLGLTTAYLALANPGAKVVSLEGAGTVAARARENLQSLSIENVTVVEANFDDSLPGVLAAMDGLDFVFVDGNHRLEPTKRYFELVLTKLHNDAVIVFDDIHWSPEMEAAWSYIKAHPATRCSIDLFYVGIIFLRREFMAKQHFTIRF